MLKLWAWRWGDESNNRNDRLSFGSHVRSCREASHIPLRSVARALEERGFDEFVEKQCSRVYVEQMGRPSLLQWRYFHLLLIGYFEGLDSERVSRGERRTHSGCAVFWEWHCRRRRRIIPLFRAPGDWSMWKRIRRYSVGAGVAGGEGLLKGKTIRIDATSLEASLADRHRSQAIGKE